MLTASATTMIRLPDGSTIGIATDDPKQAASTARTIWAKRQADTVKAPAQPERGILRNIADGVGDFVDNALPNWGDEVFAAGRAVRGLIQGRPMGRAFRDGQAEFKRDQAAYDKANPKAAWATTIGGTAAGLVALPEGRLAQGASMGAKIAHGAAVGAGYGAVSGAGEGESLSERYANARRSAAIGAAGGSLASPLMAGATSAGRAIRANVPGVEGATRRLANVPRAILAKAGIGAGRVEPGQRAREAADRLMATRMTDGEILTGMGRTGPKSSPQAIADEVARRADTGVPAMPGDVTEGMRGLTSWSSRGMGPAQAMVRQRLDARKAQEALRVRQHVTDTLGSPVDPLKQVEDATKATREAAAPLYREAYAQPMVITPEIQGIMETPAFAEAVPNAIRNIRNQIDPVTKRPMSPEALGLRLVPNPQPGTLAPNVPHIITPEGMLVLDKNLSTEGFDQVIRAMRDNGQSAMRPAQFPGGRPQNTTNSVHINSRAGDLRGHLAEQNAPFREVTQRYADDMGQLDAFRSGQDVGSLTGHEIMAQGRTIPNTAKGSWTVGARTSLADAASKHGADHPTGSTARHVEKMLGDGVKQEAIGDMTGNTGGVRQLLDRLESEQQGNLVWNEVRANSRTQGRKKLDEDMDEMVSQGSPTTLRGVIGHAVLNIASRANTQFRKDVKARIAQVVTEANPQTVRELMAAVADRARRDRDFATALHRAGLFGTKAYAGAIIPESGE